MADEMKDRILDSADELFSERGVRDVTIDDVCRRISISKKTFYQYYSQKEDLVEEVIGYHLQKKIDYFNALLHDKNPIEVMAITLYEVEKKKMFSTDKRIMGNVRKYYPNTLKKHFCKKHDMLKEIAKEYMERGVAEGYFKRDIDMDAILFLLVMTHKAMVSYIDGEIPTKGRRISNRRLSSAYMEIVLSSILSEKGWSEYAKLSKIDTK